MSRIAALVALVSGICGLAHEVVFARLLGTYLGNMFYVDAAVLATFLAGLGLGAAASSRLRSLWWCEAAAGAWALMTAGGLGLVAWRAPHALIEVLSPLGAAGPGVAVLVVVLVTAPPAFLIGTAVPWLAARSSPQATGAFARIYALSNLGAALCVLAVELVLIPSIGVRATLALVGAINLVDAALLFVFLRRVDPASDAPLASSPPTAPWVTLALFALSALSGLSQLFVLKSAQALVGPYQTTFAMLLAGTLVGIALGARLARARSFADERSALAIVALGAALACSATYLLVGPLASLHALLADRGVAAWVLSLAVITPLAIVPAAAFGASVPALSQSRPRASGHLLFVSSLGNVAGYLLAMWIIWESVPDAVLASAIPLGAALLAVGLGAGTLRTVAVVALGVALVPSALWPTDVLRVGNMAVASRGALDVVRGGGLVVRGARVYGTEAVLVRDRGGDDTLVLDGHLSMRISKAGRTNRAELLVGTAPALLAERRERGMVIGLGTGISAGALASLVERVRVVELSPAMLALLPALAPHNLGLLERAGTEVVLADGIAALAADPARYDVIVNTVNAPRFFASSKLYSEEFLWLVRARLAPGGVYATWLDASAGPEGVDAIVRTVTSVFPACAYVSLKGAYGELVCGEGPLTLRLPADDAWPPELRAALGMRADGGVDALGDLLRAAVFVDVQPRLSAGPRHTLDRPVLEHAPLPGAGAHKTPWDAVSPDIARGGDGALLDAAGVAARCAVLQAFSDPPPAGCRPGL